MAMPRRIERRSTQRPGAAVAPLPDQSDEIMRLRERVERLEQTVHQLCTLACFDPALPIMDASEWKTVKQAAFTAGVTIVAVYRWAHAGKVRWRKYGGKIYIETASLPGAG